MGGGKVILIITAMEWHLMTNFTPTIYMQIWEKMSLAISSGGKNEWDSCVVKDAVQSSYNNIADVTYEKDFLNMGLYDKKIYREYQQLYFSFSEICPRQPVDSQLLYYYLIRQLIPIRFFKKRLLEIGSGNGCGLK